MLATGSAAPAFALPDLTGSEQTPETLLSSGAPVLLAFFKVSCPTCQLTLPYLERFRSEAGLYVAGISQNNAADTREFARDYQLAFPMLLDDPDRYAASNAFAITNVPSMFLIDAERTVKWSSHGFSKPDLEELGRLLGFTAFRAGDKVPHWKPG